MVNMRTTLSLIQESMCSTKDGVSHNITTNISQTIIKNHTQQVTIDKGKGKCDSNMHAENATKQPVLQRVKGLLRWQQSLLLNVVLTLCTNYLTQKMKSKKLKDSPSHQHVAIHVKNQMQNQICQ